MNHHREILEENTCLREANEELLEALVAYLNARENVQLEKALAAECDRLRDLNKELVEALQLADAKLNGWLDASHEDRAKEAVRAAIARAKGGRDE
jgi:hypothetical protein